MIKRHNNTSLMLGVPGLVMQLVGNLVPISPVINLLLLFGGTAMLIIGLAFYAKAKGRNPVWCLMGFLSLIGLIVLAVLPDLAKDGLEPHERAALPPGASPPAA